MASRTFSKFGAVVAFIGAPVVGAIAGGLAVSLSTPGPAAMLGVNYFLFGTVPSSGAALLFGAPLLVLLRRNAKYSTAYFIIAAIAIALTVAAAFQTALAGKAALPPVHTIIFAVVTGVVTAALLLHVHREAHAA